MSQATDWNPNYSHPDGAPPASDADPNVTDPIPLGKTFNSGEEFKFAAHKLMLFIDGAGDLTITTYVQIDAPDNVTGAANGWVAISTGDNPAAGIPVIIPVPANARLHCRITARTGTPAAFYAAILSA